MRNILKRLLLLLAAALLLQPATAVEKYVFRPIDTGNGLPDNNVRNMLMLPDGLMCIQTSTMLNLYDGTACSSYAYDLEQVPYTEYNGLNYTCYDAAEKRLWCMTRDQLWAFDLTTRRFDYDAEHHFERFGLPALPVCQVHVDRYNDYWIVLADNTLWHCRRESGRADRIDLPQEVARPLTILESDNRIWLLTLDGTLVEYHTERRAVRAVHRLGLAAETEQSRMATAVDSHNNLWMMFDHSLVYYDTSTEKITQVRALDLSKQDIYTSIAVDRDDHLWVGSSHSGVCKIDGRTFEPQRFPYLQQTDGRRTLPHTDISKIYVDPRGGLWIATQAEGLLYWHQEMMRIHTINNTTLTRGHMADEGVKCMVEDADGTLLVGTIRGLLRYDPHANTLTEAYPELRNELCISLYIDTSRRIWLGTFNNGAFCIDRGRIRHYYWPEASTVDVSYHNGTPNNNSVRTFCEDRHGNFWISVYGGIGRFDPEHGTITLQRETHPELSRYMIVRDICEQADGRLLISGDNGHYLYDPVTDRVNPGTEPCYTPHVQALIDPHGWIWHATSNGIEVDTGDTPMQITLADGLLENNCMSMVTDYLGNIWAATFSGISRITLEKSDSEGYTASVTTYTVEDGVSAGVFFQKSFLRHSSGDLYFGGAHGIDRLVPDKSYQERGNPAPFLSALRIDGKKIEIGQEYNGRVLLPAAINQLVRIDLKHTESFLTFEFSNLNYINPTHTAYRYRLLHFDDTWRELHPDGAASVSYTYLSPGDYVFEVIASDNGMDWSQQPARLPVTIHPPFYRTTVAYILYTLLTLLLMVLVVLSVIRRARRRMKYRQALEYQRQHEQLEQIKLRFYTNISHELRTPLTLILLPLESLLRELADETLRPKLETMHRNAQQLLSLVNNLLDFRKLETGNEQLHLTHGNIVEFTEHIVESFREACRRYNIEIAFDSTLPAAMMVFDSSQIAKVINNILSNALKFTKPKGGGMLTVRIAETELHGEEAVRIEIADTGIGIPEADVAHIFDRFYRSNNSSSETGTGIGLNLVKQYVEMHRGTVEVASVLGSGATFTLTLPMAQGPANERMPETEDAGAAALAAETPAPARSDTRKTLMIVDDNDDFREYLVSELSDEYALLTATDGESCLAQLATATPDVLVCDIMMPGISGFEVTKRIKSDIETSHLPVILLTARNSDDARREGYETGADAYLSKPFDMQVLRARIRNLLRDRERRISDFTQTVKVKPSQISITTLDEELMGRIFASVERHMDNTEYSVEQLAADVGMHRMSLYRKLQYLTNMTPTEFIRTMRLKRAAQLLLSDRSRPVAEIADRVGFGTTDYFTKYFRKMFGCSPTHYRTEHS